MLVKLNNLQRVPNVSYLYKEIFTDTSTRPDQRESQTERDRLCPFFLPNLTYPLYLHSPMLLRNSFCNTKKFFRKTLQSFKSFFSAGGDHYQRIPKTSPYNTSSYSLGAIDMNIQASYKDLDKFYTDFTNQWESSDEVKITKKRSNKKNNTASSTPIKQEKEVLDGSFMNFTTATSLKNNNQCRENQQYLTPKGVHESKRQKDSESYSASTREERSCLLAEKLRELEMMDMSNVDHVLDIEEVLHYYSRLNCPAYLDIVDKFFMDMYAEFFGNSAANPSALISSRMAQQKLL